MFPNALLSLINGLISVILFLEVMAIQSCLAVTVNDAAPCAPV